MTGVVQDGIVTEAGQHVLASSAPWPDTQVQDDGMGRKRAEVGPGTVPVGEDVGRVAFLGEQLIQQVEDDGLIVDHGDARGHRGGPPVWRTRVRHGRAGRALSSA